MTTSFDELSSSVVASAQPRIGSLSEHIARMKAVFESKTLEFEGIETWLARDLQKLLGYSEWRSFQHVIAKAKAACQASGASVADHFIDVSITVDKDDGGSEKLPDIALTRYASYLIAQNGDPHKAPVAFAQTYFALQTRKQEVLEERLAERERLLAREKLGQTERELSGVLYERGVDERGFGIIRSKGDAALFDGLTTSDMKRRLNVPESRSLADFLPTVTIKAKDLAAEITKHTVKTTTIRGIDAISGQHVQSNSNVRKALVSSGIRPEALPPAEDIKKVERRIKSEAKTLTKDALRLR